jgi:transcriptional regulator with XRE-family HTH domain
MNEQIKQIAERLVGLREVLEMSPQEVAKICDMSVDDYLKLESGTVDISVSVLHKISQALGVELTVLMFGDEPKMNSYFVTRKGKGTSVERSKAYKYYSLAAGFANRKADPFLVVVEPNDKSITYLNTHIGQEFNMVLEGKMLISIGGKEITLEEGDSIYFDSSRPHGMKALDGKRVCLLVVIL